jgi:acyl-coenzyme A thioesterase PaaI-like protein
VDEGLASRREAAAALRHLIGVVAHARLGDDELAGLASSLQDLADGVRPHWDTTRYRDEALPGPVVLDAHPFHGRSHAFAPPLELHEVDGRITGAVTFTHNYEGYPDVVHGGLVAAVFDTIVARAASLSGLRFMTGTLSVRYRRPTPVGVRLAIEAEPGPVSGRRIVARGRLRDPAGDVTAEAEGLFVSIPDDRYRQAGAPSSAQGT